MKYLNKIASLVALFIGTLSVIAGGKVLLGIDTKTYNILNWLVVYNVAFGFVSIVVVYLIWAKNRIAKKAIIFVFASHLIVLSYLYFLSNTVASESIKAMTFRVSIWALILLLFAFAPIDSQKKSK